MSWEWLRMFKRLRTNTAPSEGLAEAERRLRESQARGREVSAEAGRLRRLRERNMFAESIAEIFREPR